MKTRISLLLTLVLFGVATIAVPAFAAEKGVQDKDKKFAMKAASGGMMEVQLGQMVQGKAQSQEVKDFAARMVTDHGKANDELKQIAQQKNLTLPAQMEKEHQSLIDKMGKMSGTELDKMYMREMVKDHVKDVAKFRKASQTLKDQELKGWAEKTLPVLEHHLQEAKTVAQKLGVDVKKAEQEARKQSGAKEKKGKQEKQEKQ